ncbi:MAG: hypothetical protein AAGF92_15015 [Myxococcota bacterium]
MSQNRLFWVMRSADKQPIGINPDHVLCVAATPPHQDGKSVIYMSGPVFGADNDVYVNESPEDIEELMAQPMRLKD